MKLKDIKCYLLDMDGTIYLGNELIAGARHFIETLEEQGKQYFFLTNNSSRDKASYVDKLTRLGIPATADQVMTSGEATAIQLRAQKPGAKIFLVGNSYLAREFRHHGFRLAEKDDAPDYVVVGFDTSLTYQKLWEACDLVRDGTEYIATHPDLNCPLEGGKYAPDAGAIIAFIQASTGQRPRIIGKPNADIVQAILTKTNFSRQQVAMVGDRLYTDIALGQNAGLTSILVLSGETDAKAAAQGEHKPDYVFLSVQQLAEALKSRSGR